MDYKIGDFLLTDEKELFVIMDIYHDRDGIHYDVKSTKALEILDNSLDLPLNPPKKVPRMIHCIPEKVIKHFGMHIPGEKMKKSAKILYG